MMTSMTVPERLPDHTPDARTPLPPAAQRTRFADPGTDPQTIRVQTRIPHSTLSIPHTHVQQVGSGGKC
jgi:hypothetical protein